MEKRQPEGPWLTLIAWWIAGLCAILGSMGGLVGGLVQNMRSGAEDTGWIVGGALIGFIAGLLLKRFIDFFE